MNKNLKAVVTAVLLLWSIGAGAQRHDRGYDMSNPVSFVGQGWWMIGGTADYSFHNMEDYSFAVVEGIDLLGYNLTVSPAFCYMLKDNFGIGARVEYSRNMAKIDTAKVSIAGVDLALDRYHTIDHSIETKAILRNYIPIGDQKEQGGLQTGRRHQRHLCPKLQRRAERLPGFCRLCQRKTGSGAEREHAGT